MVFIEDGVGGLGRPDAVERLHSLARVRARRAWDQIDLAVRYQSPCLLRRKWAWERRYVSWARIEDLCADLMAGS